MTRDDQQQVDHVACEIFNAAVGSPGASVCDPCCPCAFCQGGIVHICYGCLCRVVRDRCEQRRLFVSGQDVDARVDALWRPLLDFTANRFASGTLPSVQ